VRGLFGVVSLLVVLAVVGIVAVKQLKAVGAVPATPGAVGSASDPSGGTPATVREQSMRLQDKVRSDVVKALEQGARKEEVEK
jgi:hypothetical protein